MLMKERIGDEGVLIDDLEWQEFPTNTHTGGLEWKLLHVGPEAPSWTVLFRATKDVTAFAHIHHGQAFVYQTAGEIYINGHTVSGAAFGYEGPGASHPSTLFKAGTEFFMIMFGSVDFFDENGERIVMTWQDAQRVWAEQNSVPVA